MCCYQKVQRMKTLLKNLYDCFYTPPEFSEQKREVEEYHQALIQVLEKPERRLVLRIMDAQSLMAEEHSIDSFISGFELAWQLSMELNQYEKECSVSRCTAKRSSALSMSGEKEATLPELSEETDIVPKPSPAQTPQASNRLLESKRLIIHRLARSK